jgi:putative hemolysin
MPGVDDLTLKLLAVPLLIGLNAFFVCSEYALVAVRPAQLDLLRQRGRRRAAQSMQTLKKDPASAIGAIQVCITLTNLLLGWIGEPAMSAVLMWTFEPVIALAPGMLIPVSVAMSFLIVTLLTVVFSELLPKAMTLQYVLVATVLTASPVVLIMRIVRPIVSLMNGMANLVTRPLGLGKVQDLEQPQVTAQEIRAMTVEAAAGGVLSTGERSMILNALALGRRKANQIMVPRIRVQYLDLRRSMDENRQVMNEYLHSRLPLCDGGMDKVIGVVHVKEFLSAYHAAGDSSVLSLIARPAFFAPEATALNKLLAMFHEHRTEMIFLVDEYGGMEGIVTLKDVVDELVGEIHEMTQQPAAHAVLPIPRLRVATGPMVVPGDMPLHELAEQIERHDWPGETSAATINGLIVEQLGHVARTGETLTIDHVRLRVVESDERSVRRVEVTPVEKDEATE